MVGLAPSAVAAQVLADDLGIQTGNTAKWWEVHERTGATFQAGQLVIVDEASLAGTLSLDRITEVIDTYMEHRRITGGDTETMIVAAYAAWRADWLAGRAAVLVTDSNESVLALNQRARTDLILDGTVNALREVEPHDGTRAAAGDSVITRHDDRRLRAGRGWVRNGDRWTVTDVRDDGSLTLRCATRRWGASVVLPADYVAEHLDLGYAVTSYRAQGITVDRSQVLVDAAMTRENLYVALTRGRDANLAYVAIDKPDPAHEGPHPGDNPEATARSVLFGVLQHVGAELSAHETLTAEQDA